MDIRNDSHRHKHENGHDHDFHESSRRSLWIAFALITSYMFAEFIGAYIADSLSLFADAFHMATDSLALGLALLALWIASRPASSRYTFGFGRAEILAALLNVASLWLVSAWIFYEAFIRFQDPPEVKGPLMLSVGFIGFLVNIAATWVLRSSAKENLNVEGAFLHALGDMLGSVGVVVGGLLITAFGWFIIDPIFGVVIGSFVILTSSRLLFKVLHVLMERTPGDINLGKLCEALETMSGVAGVHDLHVWSLAGGSRVMSAHVTSNLSSALDRDALLIRLREVTIEGFRIDHVTIQLEDNSLACLETHHFPHPKAI